MNASVFYVFAAVFENTFQIIFQCTPIIPQMEPLLQVFQQKVYAHFLSPMLTSVSVFGLYLLYAGTETAVDFML